MPRSLFKARRLAAALLIAALVAGVFGGATSAHAAAPVVTGARFTGPIAYELKSLLTTRLTCNVDQAGTTGRLDILGANGVVKTIYNGPMTAGTNWLPVWNGLDSAGKRLPSATYDWKLTVAKGGESTVVRGKIAVSKISFIVKGNVAPGAAMTADRYMIPGTANCYIRASTSSGDTVTMLFSINLSYTTTRLGQTMTIPYPGDLLSISNGATYTHYLRSPWTISSRGNRRFTIRNNSVDIGSTNPDMNVYMTVIQ